MPNVLIFSDLDGTLLDHETYSFEAATQALELIKSRNIPLVLCTSKARKEIEVYRNLLNNNCPFIAENGGGIFIPEDYFPVDYKYDRKIDRYNVIEIGTPRKDLTQALTEISDETGIMIKTFSDMSTNEIAELTGLEPKTAELAMERDYSEPFVLEDEKYTATIKEKISLKGYTHTRGGRFHHILGGNDKGKAVDILTNIYKSEYVDVKTVAIGDSLNDLPMLSVVDQPILVKKPGGTYDTNIDMPGLIYADGIGPSGWNSSILKLFVNYD